MINNTTLGLFLKALQSDSNAAPRASSAIHSGGQAVGSIITGRVVEVLPNQVYRLAVGNNELQVKLAGQFKVGETLTLQTNPRPTPAQTSTTNQSALITNVSAATNVALARVSNTAPNIQAAKNSNAASNNSSAPLNARVIARGEYSEIAFAGQVPQNTSQTEQPQLSDAARLISSLPRQNDPQAPRVPLQAPLPLLNQAPQETEQLAQALAKSVQQSGLFYESHLARWVAKRYPQSELLAEPQARWQSTDNLMPANNTTVAGDTAQEVKTMSNPQTTVPVMIQQQLDVLESQQILWQGTLWPGHQAEIAITEERARDNSAQEENSTWTTELQVHMPTLGTLKNTISLRGNNMQLQIQAASVASVTKLRDALPELVGALRELGFTINLVGIKNVG